MRYAIISDIHSNLEALTAVLNHIENNKVDKILCLGDLIGYGPNPNECVEIVKSNCSLIIAGNHDFACIEESEIEYFNPFAKQAIFWTIDNLSDSAYSFISQLKLYEKVDNIYLVHASPENPSMWNYILSIDQAILNFSCFDTQICFIGHTHVPRIFVETNDNNYFVKKESSFKIKDEERYL
ncbi:MAG: metallophosphoesterase family protein, partial [Candidatus Hodarchaeota archaeon]